MAIHITDDRVASFHRMMMLCAEIRMTKAIHVRKTDPNILKVNQKNTIAKIRQKVMSNRKHPANICGRNLRNWRVHLRAKCAKRGVHTLYAKSESLILKLSERIPQHRIKVQGRRWYLR